MQRMTVGIRDKTTGGSRRGCQVTPCHLNKDAISPSSPLPAIKPQLYSKASQSQKAISQDDTVQINTPESTNGTVNHSLTSEKKAEVFVVRTDGFSCTREMVDENGCLYFEGTSTHQHVLMWKTRPSCVMVVKKMGNSLLEEFYSMVAHLTEEEEMMVMLEQDLYDQCCQAFPHVQQRFLTFGESDHHLLGQMVDFIVCIGGDGVLLHAAHMFKQSVPPIVAFNLGSLSFLTTFDFKDFKKAISAVIYGNPDGADTSLCQIPNCYSAAVLVTLRMRLLCEIYKGNDLTPSGSYDCLNEIVLDRGASPYLTNIECFEKGRLITRVQADGIMLATPTGSTAYSVAAGGSMVHPHVPAILLTPICPHSLTFRPVILPDYADVELRVADSTRGNAYISFDGRDRQVIGCGDRVRVRMSPHPVPTVTQIEQTNDWFNSLERCFGWNERVEQQPIDAPRSQS